MGLETLVAFLVNLLILVLVLGLVWWIGSVLIAAIPGVPGVAAAIWKAVVALIALLWVLSWVSGAPPLVIPWRR